MTLPLQSPSPGGSSAARPVIGITSYLTRAAWGVWDVECTLLPQRYVEAVAAAGAVPVVLPVVPGLLGAVLDRLDGVIVSGGPDVEPARYGAEPGPDTQPPSRSRDAAEAEVVAGAAARGLPLLGVCRGMQLLNVARGGTLVQHLPDVVGTDVHCPVPGRYGVHDVRVAPGSRLAAVLAGTDPGAPDVGSVAAGAVAGGSGAARSVAGGEPLQVGVPTYHHQGIDQVGSGLVAVAWAADGVIEAVEDPRLPYCLGVQWHPEAGDDPALFAGLVRAARNRARRPARAR